MNNRKKKVILIWLLLAGFILFLGVRVIGAIRELAKHLDASSMPVKSIPREYASVIAAKYRNGLVAINTYSTKVRPPVSVIGFDKKYCLFMSRIDLKGDISLTDLFQTSIESTSETTNKGYFLAEDCPFFKYMYLDEPMKPVSKIYCTLAGDSIECNVKNDSLLGYHFVCKNFSLRYGEHAANDVFVHGKEMLFGYTKRIPAELLFLKRNMKIYIIVTVPRDPKSAIPRNLLNDIVCGNNLN